MVFHHEEQEPETRSAAAPPNNAPEDPCPLSRPGLESVTYWLRVIQRVPHGLPGLLIVFEPLCRLPNPAPRQKGRPAKGQPF